ncbi:unnamed protein product [Protopolystoma xenopodis]|uniref:Uncharacterized protein n=1 Tax=Protopolystoma xenopodis TaxID=117903 RepID=A0A3S5CPK6_9PLAT|nr:unnamed protein product [Protopolystoma xenopodis]
MSFSCFYHFHALQNRSEALLVPGSFVAVAWLVWRPVRGQLGLPDETVMALTDINKDRQTSRIWPNDGRRETNASSLYRPGAGWKKGKELHLFHVLMCAFEADLFRLCFHSSSRPVSLEPGRCEALGFSYPHEFSSMSVALTF